MRSRRQRAERPESRRRRQHGDAPRRLARRGLQVQRGGAATHYRVLRGSHLRYRSRRRRMRRRSRRADRRRRGRYGGLPAEGTHRSRQRQRRVLRGEGQVELGRHPTLEVRLVAAQRLASEQRAVRLLRGIRRGGRALGHRPRYRGGYRSRRLRHLVVHRL